MVEIRRLLTLAQPALQLLTFLHVVLDPELFHLASNVLLAQRLLVEGVADELVLRGTVRDILVFAARFLD